MNIRALFEPSVAELQPVEIDLSAANERMLGVDLDNRNAFEAFIRNEIASGGGRCGIGGYLEDRVVYRRSAHYETQESPRSVHLGIDIWLAAGTPVFVPMDGMIHSCAINAAYGDYGGTIIIEHHVEGQPIYSLYGHLSHESVSRWQVGDSIRRGSSLGELGHWEENGNWPPHLHFQLIRDLEGKQGDYPGVCRVEDLEHYSQNCPNPAAWIV